MEREVKEYRAVWYQAASCSGDSVSFLNTAHPNVRNVLVDEILPGRHVNLRFHMTIMGGQSKPILDVLQETKKQAKGEYILIVEGSVPTGLDGQCGTLGERDGKQKPMMDDVAELAQDAAVVIALGTCAAFGGVFALAPNPCGAMGTEAFLKGRGIGTPVINIGGCPAHPDWLVGTVAHIMLFGVHKPSELDHLRRPKEFFGELVHETCPRRPDFVAGKFASRLGEPGCLYMIGCKGPMSYADCAKRGFNSHTNWCIQDGSPCHGCTEANFPELLSPLYERITHERLERFVVSKRPPAQARGE